MAILKGSRLLGVLLAFALLFLYRTVVPVMFQQELVVVPSRSSIAIRDAVLSHSQNVGPADDDD